MSEEVVPPIEAKQRSTEEESDGHTTPYPYEKKTYLASGGFANIYKAFKKSSTSHTEGLLPRETKEIKTNNEEKVADKIRLIQNEYEKRPVILKVLTENILEEEAAIQEAKKLEDEMDISSIFYRTGKAKHYKIVPPGKGHHKIQVLQQNAPYPKFDKNTIYIQGKNMIYIAEGEDIVTIVPLTDDGLATVQNFRSQLSHNLPPLNEDNQNTQLFEALRNMNTGYSIQGDTEYLAGDPLSKFLVSPLHRFQFESLGFSQRTQLMLQLVQQVCDLHRNGIIHYDLNSNNVLIDLPPNPNPKSHQLNLYLIDFGVSIRIPEGEERCRRVVILKEGEEFKPEENKYAKNSIYLCKKDEQLVAYWFEEGKFKPHKIEKAKQKKLLALMKEGDVDRLEMRDRFDNATSLCGYTREEDDNNLYAALEMDTEYHPKEAKKEKAGIKTDTAMLRALLSQLSGLADGINFPDFNLDDGLDVQRTTRDFIEKMDSSYKCRPKDALLLRFFTTLHQLALCHEAQNELLSQIEKQKGKDGGANEEQRNLDGAQNKLLSQVEEQKDKDGDDASEEQRKLEVQELQLEVQKLQAVKNALARRLKLLLDLCPKEPWKWIAVRRNFYLVLGVGAIITAGFGIDYLKNYLSNDDGNFDKTKEFFTETVHEIPVYAMVLIGMILPVVIVACYTRYKECKELEEYKSKEQTLNDDLPRGPDWYENILPLQQT